MARILIYLLITSFIQHSTTQFFVLFGVPDQLYSDTLEFFYHPTEDEATCVDRMVWNGYSRDPDYFDFKYSFHSSVASKRIAKSGWLPSFIQNNDTRTANGRVFFQQKRNWKCVPPKSNLNAKKKLMAKPSDGNIYYLFPYTSKFQASPLDSLHLSPPKMMRIIIIIMVLSPLLPTHSPHL